MMQDKIKITFRTIWSIVMGLLYVVMGCLIMFTGLILKYNFNENTPDEDNFFIVRYVLGIGIIGYGLFRFYRVFKYRK